MYCSIISHVCPEVVSPLHWESVNPSGLPVSTARRVGFSVFAQITGLLHGLVSELWFIDLESKLS